MSSILVTYNESRAQVDAAVRRYLTAMAERENAGITGVGQTNTQEAISEFKADLIPESIAYVTMEDEIPVATIISGNYEVLGDVFELNKFKIRTEICEVYTVIVPTEAFDSYSDIEYENYIKKLYDEKLLNRAIKLRDREEETLRAALEAKMQNFDALIQSLQTANNE